MPRRVQRGLSAVLAVVAAFNAAETLADQIAVVQSPDGKIVLRLKPGAGEHGLRYSVERNGKEVVEPSPLDVRVSSLGWIAKEAAIQDVKQNTIDETSELSWGKARRLRDHCSAATVRLRNARGIEWNVELRAYDEGVAFRYGFPEQQQLPDVTIDDEATEFRLAGDPTMLFLPLDGFTTSHEGLYQRKPLSKLPTDKLMEMPLLATWPNGNAAAITEARLRDFAGMYLVAERAAAGRVEVLRGRLSPLPGNKGACVVGRTPLWSPWRVILLGNPAGQLIESNLLACLNEKADSDFSWVAPGKTTFHWWNGTVEHGPPSTPESNFAIHKRYIDFCAANHIAYHSVISVAGNRPWYVQGDPPGFDPRPDTDILTPRPDLDLPRILAYAKEKGVGIRFWVYWKPLSEKLEEAFATYERWGVKGLMIDFMDRDDQEMVEWQEQVLRAAAKHKLHIQFHGSYKPSGEQRTYPNLFNREGVLNLEYLKWSKDCDPQHCIDVAYTRSLAGPTDFHLGGFRSVSRAKFEPRDERPLMLGTRCHQLALYVVYENPMPMVADSPEAYEGQAGFDFLVDVPTTWDETRFVAGEPGEYVVIARRSGTKWYLGGITNWTRRELTIPLEFLSDGNFQARIYMDGSLDEEKPNVVRMDQRKVTSAVPIQVSLAPGGGIAAVFEAK